MYAAQLWPFGLWWSDAALSDSLAMILSSLADLRGMLEPNERVVDNGRSARLRRFGAAHTCKHCTDYG